MLVKLSSPSLKDIECYHEIFSDEETHNFIIDEGQQDLDGSLKKLKKLMEINTKLKRIYTIKRQAIPVGFVVIHLDQTTKPFISYAIRRSFWRQGIAFEAILNLIETERNHFEGFKAATHLDNTASQKLLLKVPFVEIGIKELEMGERLLFEYIYPNIEVP